MSCSLSQSRAEYRRKRAAHNAQKNKNSTSHMYKPKNSITIKCKYCKEEGHKVGYFDKKLQRFVTTCEKALESNRKKAEFNRMRTQRQKEAQASWKQQVSEAVAEATGSSGWDTAGSKDLTTATVQTKKPVFAVSKNPFALSDDEDDDVEQQKKKARKEAHEARQAAAKVAPRAVPPPPVLAWGPPRPGLGPRQETLSAEPIAAKPELVRAPRKTTTPVNSDSSDDDAPAIKRSSSLPRPHTPPPTIWGDEE